MRERLTLWFVALTVSVLAVALLVRSHELGGQLREQRAETLRAELVVARIALEQHLELGRPVDERFLADLATADQQLVFDAPGTADVRAAGSDFAPDLAAADEVSARVAAGGGELVLTRAAVAEPVADQSRRTLWVTLLLAAVFAGLVGWLIARRLAAPFRRLAVAADHLARGRFDVDLPRSSVPEVQAITTALAGSAGRMRERLGREQDFAQHASHVLRTPLTGLRMELEELSVRDDVPADAREAIERSLTRIDAMDVVAGELVELSRRGSLAEGSQVALRELATTCAQRWADALAEHDRPLSASVEGDLESSFTPGPVEHVLDLLLADVLRRGQGPVRMVFDAATEGTLKITVASSGDSRAARGTGVEVPLTQAGALVAALGGRLSGDDPSTGIEIRMPRR